ncbi:MAG: aldehyde dehydrogenase family protein [Candidatus Limnocylindrales bacterium]
MTRRSRASTTRCSAPDGVFTNDLAVAWRSFNELEVGGVIVKAIPTYWIDHMPYGGVKDSGLGREGLR